MQEQVTLPPLAPGRDLALERSQKVSRALHDAARKARLTVRNGAAWQVASRGGRANRSYAIVSALVLFVLPTLAAAGEHLAVAGNGRGAVDGAEAEFGHL